MRALTLLAALTLAWAIPPAAGFLSTPPGESMHDAVTEEAARPLGFDGEALTALKGAVRHPDLVETRVDAEEGRAVALAGERYEPSHHCDRLPTSTHAKAFAAAVDYIRMEREFALDAVRAGAYSHAMRALGQALHALQDCHSHTDIVDRSVEEQRAFQELLLTGRGRPVEVRVSGFHIHDDEEPSNWPPGDPYPHGDHNRDDANATQDAETRLPDGRTKFEAARALAVDTTHRFLDAYLRNLTTGERNGLMAVITDLEDRGAPSPSFAALASVLAVAAWQRRSCRRAALRGPEPGDGP